MPAIGIMEGADQTVNNQVQHAQIKKPTMYRTTRLLLVNVFAIDQLAVRQLLEPLWQVLPWGLARPPLASDQIRNPLKPFAYRALQQLPGGLRVSSAQQASNCDLHGAIGRVAVDAISAVTHRHVPAPMCKSGPSNL